MSWLQRMGTLVDTLGGPARMRRFRTGWPAHTSTEIRFFATDNVQYRYRERGEGQTIVFTADPPVTLELYDTLLEVFAAHYRVVIVELAGMGFSAPNTHFSFGWRETNDDLTQFLRSVAGEQAILAFSCVAGLAAVDIATRYPELVSRLVLMQTGDVEAFARWKAGRDPKGILAKPFLGQYLMKRMAPKRMPDWYRLSVGAAHAHDTFCHCTAESFTHGALWSLASAYQRYMDPNVVLGRPTQPVLALWGLADGSHPPENAQTPKRLAENVEYHAFATLGHFLELEDPEAAFAAIHAFTQQSPLSAS
ncbi:MAG: alpha/beta hydrolase [Pseudomonadota bacterium]